MRVPTVDGPSVNQQGLPGVRESSVASPELLGAGARQLGALGEAVSTAGAEIDRIRQQQVAQANALRVDDALNQAQEQALRLQHDKDTGFTSQTGYAALSRESGQPLADEYTGKLKESVDRIAGTLSNEDQRRAFGAKVNGVVSSFYGHALAHEATQQREYNMSVRDATVTNARNALSLNPTDPANVDAQATRIRAAIEGGQDEKGNFIPGSAQLQGKSAAWAREKSSEAVSDAHGNAIKGALQQGNVNLAMAYFNRYAKDMTAKDVLEVQGTLQKDYDTRLGATVADQVFDQNRTRIVPNDYTRLTALVEQQESGGRRYGTGGALLTSPKGAQGEMQVMPATAKDPGFGVKPAADDSPAELARVGKDYLAAMVVRFKGDVPKALAAYNAGPGAVDKAVAEADKDRQTGAFRAPPAPDYWLSKLPKETRDYVAGISAKFGTGGGTPARPTLAELHDQARAILGPNASPLAVKNAEERITQRYTDQDKAVKQRSEETVARAMQALTQNGGRFSELPASLRADLTTFAPEKVDDVMNFGARVSKGDDTTNPALYLRLSDPNTLRGMSEAQLYGLRGQLSLTDYQHFANERNKLLNPHVTPTDPGDLNSSAIKNTLDQRLRELQIDPTPKDDGGKDSARVGAIRRFVDGQILAAQRAAGKKFSDAETTAFIDKLAATSSEMKGWFSTYHVPLLAAKPGDIPGATRDAIKQAFKKQGVDDPTDAQILNTFLHMSVQPKK